MSICRVCHEPFGRVEDGRKHVFFWFACKDCVKKARTKARFHNRRKKATGTFSPSDWLIMLLEHHFKCADCGFSKPHLTLDHKVSIFIGGENTLANMQPLCEQCHSSKAKIENAIFNSSDNRKKRRRKYNATSHSNESLPGGGSGGLECQEVSACL